MVVDWFGDDGLGKSDVGDLCEVEWRYEVRRRVSGLRWLLDVEDEDEEEELMMMSVEEEVRSDCGWDVIDSGGDLMCDVVSGFVEVW